MWLMFAFLHQWAFTLTLWQPMRTRDLEYRKWRLGCPTTVKQLTNLVVKTRRFHPKKPFISRIQYILWVSDGAFYLTLCRLCIFGRKCILMSRCQRPGWYGLCSGLMACWQSGSGGNRGLDYTGPALWDGWVAKKASLNLKHCWWNLTDHCFIYLNISIVGKLTYEKDTWSHFHLLKNMTET